jgi:spermidine/putrescine transport system ATP-binding protein
VAAFVGANNRVEGRVAGADGDAVEIVTPAGLKLGARREGAMSTGDAALAFIRPESIVLARDRARLSGPVQTFVGEVESLLFDGANSAVLVRELVSRLEFRIALPQTGGFADLAKGERVAFGFEPTRVVCFRAVAS